MIRGPTQRQLQIHGFMLAYQAQHSMPPTVREICDAIGVRWTNGVVEQLRRLHRSGLVDHRERIARGWVATPAQQEK